MKKIIISLFLLAVGVTAFAQQNWKKFDLDERVSVEVPGELKKGDMENITMYVVETEDSSGMNVTVIDFVSFGLDSAMMQSMVNTEMFEEQFKTGFMGRFNNGELLSFKSGKLNDLTTYLLEVKMDDEESGKSILLYPSTVFSGSKAYSFNYASANPVPTTREKFFGSVTVK